MFIFLFISLVQCYILQDRKIILPPVHTTVRAYTLNITQSFDRPAGFYRAGFLVNGQSPGPLIEGDEDDWVKVTINNLTPVSFTIHFHGILQKGTPWFDGVPGVSQYPILSGDSYTHYFQLKQQYGSAWYHSHFRGYSMDGIVGPIYIRPKKGRLRPYSMVSSEKSDIEQMMEGELDPTNIIIDDYFKLPSDSIILKTHQYGIDPLCIQSILVNGKGRVYCHDADDLNDNSTSVIDTMGCVQDLNSNGFADLRSSMDHNGLENPGFSSRCQATSSDLLNLKTQKKKWQYFNIINAGVQYTKAFSIDDHDLYVIAVDGIFVKPRKAHQVQIPSGSRVTIIVQTDESAHYDTKRPYLMRFAAIHCPQYIEGLAQLSYDDTLFLKLPSQNGFRVQNLQGKVMDGFETIELHEMSPLNEEPVRGGKAHHTFNLFLNRTGVVEFSMFKNGVRLPAASELSRPLHFERPVKQSHILDSNIKPNQVIDIIMNNFRRYNHPIHLHGHLFRLISFSKNESFEFNTVKEALAKGFEIKADAPCFDSILVPPKGHAVIRFVANNPGIWLLHCHNLGHLLGGMGAIIYESLGHVPLIPHHLLDQAHVSNSLDATGGFHDHDSSYLLPEI